MNPDSYKVLPYTEKNLLKCLDLDILESSVIKKKRHYTYFCEYLGTKDGLGAKTIVIEKKYVSKAYLSDYSNYYSSCFQDYDRFCQRVHFFDITLSAAEFATLLLDQKSEALQESYLGYVVVKPLPESIIGPTLLKPYGNTENRVRSYTTTRKYPVSLFGRPLIIHSLAFQEQDTVVSACATTAIWSAFHRTSELFQTHLPSPSEITKSAGNLFLNSGRTFPNQGLNLTQICKAIEGVGLVSELRNSTLYRTDMSLAKRFIYAYSKAGIPVLLFIKLKDREHHLAVVTGFSVEKKKSNQSTEINLVADKIERLYVHDDQVGPFARYGFVDKTALETSWIDDKGTPINAWLHAIIVPIHPKIRISFDDVYKKNNIVDRIISLFELNVEWDIYLTASNDYKKEVLFNPLVSDRVKSKSCFNGLPKYIWLARAKAKDNLIFEFIFDSTDISRGHYCWEFNLYDPDYRIRLLNVFLETREFLEFEGVNLGKSMYKKVITELENDK